MVAGFQKNLRSDYCSKVTLEVAFITDLYAKYRLQKGNYLNRYNNWVSNEVGKAGLRCVNSISLFKSQAVGSTCIRKYMLMPSFTFYFLVAKRLQKRSLKASGSYNKLNSS